ncbi:MAG: DUF1080 domain-containing protein [Saprospiraceae bacterium]
MNNLLLLFLSFLSFLSGSFVYSQESKADITGKWDLEIYKDGKQLPSWLEISKSGRHTLVGRFVHYSGSARPISEIKVDDKGKFWFSIPPQWEGGTRNLYFEGFTDAEGIKGSLRYVDVDVDGKTFNWTGKRAPKLAYTENPKWGKPISLFNKKNLDGWHVNGKNQWKVENEILKNVKAGGNLISNEQFTDFKMHIEFRYPKGSNSGIYLRGRYEVQIADNQGLEPTKTLFSSIYGFFAPNEMMARGPGEWQEFDITLIGRRVTIIANGKAVIIDQNIPGITGGALDSKEGEPGPIFIQGDHGSIEFRKIEITPIH